MKVKKIAGKRVSGKERVVGERVSYDKEKPIWMFDKIDRDGKFAFDVRRVDFCAEEILQKIIDYSNMTWGVIKIQTHDDGESKHHTLKYNELSKEVIDRIEKLELDEQTDAFFSFAFTNLVRIVGIREQAKFHVLWYDPKHEICPAKKKHT